MLINVKLKIQLITHAVGRGCIIGFKHLFQIREIQFIITFGSCTAPQPSAEICDGLDNDCDGTPDNASGICSDGKICVNGACQDPPSNLNNAGVEDAAGCDCTVGEAAPELPALPLLGLTLLVGLVLMRRRD